jgi:hypothetical protein
MKRQFRASSTVPAALFALLLINAYPGRSAVVNYTFTTLDNPADPTFNQLLGVNNAGSIVGYFGVGSQTHPNKGYQLVPPASYTNENFPGSFQTQVVGITPNSGGTTVGFWVDANGNNFGFVDQNNVFTSVTDPNVAAAGTLFTQLLGVNDNGVAAGFYADVNGDFQGFLYTIAGATFTPVVLPASFNATMTVATGVNDAGIVPGFYVDAAGNTHGFLDNHGAFTSFDDPSAVGNTMFLGLNNMGQVVGSYADANGTTNGLVYNFMLNSWQTVSDPLSSATPAFDVTGTTINGINDHGMLVGFYSDGTNVNGFEATAAPEPGSMSLLLIGAGLVFAGWKHRMN